MSLLLVLSSLWLLALLAVWALVRVGARKPQKTNVVELDLRRRRALRAVNRKWGKR